MTFRKFRKNYFFSHHLGILRINVEIPLNDARRPPRTSQINANGSSNTKMIGHGSAASRHGVRRCGPRKGSAQTSNATRTDNHRSNTQMILTDTLLIISSHFVKFCDFCKFSKSFKITGMAFASEIFSIKIFDFFSKGPRIPGFL